MRRKEGNIDCLFSGNENKEKTKAYLTIFSKRTWKTSANRKIEGENFWREGTEKGIIQSNSKKRN